MWPGNDVNPMASRFMAARAAAANVPTPGEQGSYSPDMFYMDFPQFTKRIPPGEEGGAESVESLVPEGILNMFVDQANDSVLPSRWGSMWRYAAGLYTAHFAALYLKTWAPGSDNSGQAAGSAAQPGAVKSATMGDTSISYDNSAITAGTEKWGAWNATQYGSQLVTMARLVGMGGMYAI
ncbi:DUF4054 domain-containing protein [Clostridiaceae bacterium]|nr:DUF4054 domain-containing protein [Clostridiaceae bacterium]